MRRLTSQQVGAALGLSAATVQKYARDGRIPFAATPGGHRRFDLAEVRAALYDEGPRGLARPTLAPEGGLGTGPDRRLGAHARYEHTVRATVTVTDPSHAETNAATDSAIDELIGTARRLAIATLR